MIPGCALTTGITRRDSSYPGVLLQQGYHVIGMIRRASAGRVVLQLGTRYESWSRITPMDTDEMKTVWARIVQTLKANPTSRGGRRLFSQMSKSFPNLLTLCRMEVGMSSRRGA